MENTWYKRMVNIKNIETMTGMIYRLKEGRRQKSRAVIGKGRRNEALYQKTVFTDFHRPHGGGDPALLVCQQYVFGRVLHQKQDKGH